MSEQLPAKPNSRASKMGADKQYRPPIGSWHWVESEEPNKDLADDDDEEKAPKEMLMCVSHLASNHVQFERPSGDGGYWSENVRYRDLLARTRPEPNWKEILEKEIDEWKVELQKTVALLADTVKQCGLLPEENPDVEPTLLPALSKRSPEQAKKDLIQLRDKDYPALQKTVGAITKTITGLHRSLLAPMLIEGKKMEKAVDGVEDRLFVLELYAGLWQEVEQIGDGKSADAETPVTVRQMLRYMDEETLIDYDKGGIDYSNLEDFDKWVAKPENRDRIIPEPRSVVALQIRRHAKDYGRPTDLADAFDQMHKHMANKKTYLLIRNGEKLYRLATEIDFKPRLLPYKEEFVRSFQRRSYNWKKHEDEYEDVTPDDLDYDKHVEERLKQIFKYNRVLFLIQGLLDRSKVFNPHPPINLANPDHVERYFKPKFDEEEGLPSANPPKWEEYRDKLNAKIRPGMMVWCDETEEDREIWNRYGKWTKSKHEVRRPRICKVYSVSRDRKKVTFRWSMGDRIKEEWVVDMTRPHPKGPSWYYQKKLEHNLGERFAWQVVDMENCFNVQSYSMGDYKKFLCDAYLKGEYLQWARQLLSAEKWQQDQWKKDTEAKQA